MHSRATQQMTLLLAILLTVFCLTGMSLAQTTAFTYQGKLTDAGTPANGPFDLQFALFDVASGGTLQGGPLTREDVTVSGGVFTVSLDFGAAAFPGAARFLEIGVRPGASTGAFTLLTPRQPVTATPYAIRSLSAANADTAANATNAVNATNATNATNAVNFSGALAGDVTGTQGATTVARLQGRAVANTAPTSGQVLKFNAANNRWEPDTDNVSGGGSGTITGVTAGTGLSGGGASGNVTLGIANGGVGATELATNAVTTTKLADSSVTDAKIAAVASSKLTGAVAIANGGTGLMTGPSAAGQFLRSSGAGSWAVGSIQAGDLPTLAYVAKAGDTMTGTLNLPANGLLAGGNQLALVGGNVGIGTTNPILGKLQVESSTNIGVYGKSNVTHGTGVIGEANGVSAYGVYGITDSGLGVYGTSGTGIGVRGDSFSGTGVFGFSSSGNAVRGNSSSGIGVYSDSSTGIGVFGHSGTIIGVQGNSSSGTGVHGSSTFGVGVFGSSTSGASVYGVGTGFFKGDTPLNSTYGKGVAIGFNQSTTVGYLFAYNYATSQAQSLALNSPGGNVGIGTADPQRLLHVNGRARIGVIPPDTNMNHVCFTETGDLTLCPPSSLRYKTAVQPFRGGLDIVRRLQPINFTWKMDGKRDVGLAAEDVARVAPAFVYPNREGAVEGVSYDRLSIVFINAIKEQQKLIEQLQARLARLERTARRRGAARQPMKILAAGSRK